MDGNLVKNSRFSIFLLLHELPRHKPLPLRQDATVTLPIQHFLKPADRRHANARIQAIALVHQKYRVCAA